MSVRVQIPAPLRRLTGADAEVALDVAAPVTIDSVLDALESKYPGLKGTIRDHVTRKRRPFVRFFALQEDLSHDPTDAPLSHLAALLPSILLQGLGSRLQLLAAPRSGLGPRPFRGALGERRPPVGLAAVIPPTITDYSVW